MRNIKIKLSILLLAVVLPTISFSNDQKIELTWFGATCVNISDGETSIFIDPFLDRPSFWDVLSFSALKTNPAVIDMWLSKIDKSLIKGIFTTHTHYDHVLNLVDVQKVTGSKVYGTDSTYNILKGEGLEQSFNKIKAGQTVEIGEFKITALPGNHPPHFFDFILAGGKILSPLKSGSSAYQYKVGEVFNYYIEHPKGNILFHSSARKNKSQSFKNFPKVDVLVLSLAKRISTLNLIQEIVLPLGPKILIPVHHDDFFTPLIRGISFPWYIDFEEFQNNSSYLHKKMKISLPKYGETISL